MKLLHIAASPKLDEQSVGKRVANAFVLMPILTNMSKYNIAILICIHWKYLR